MANITLTVPDAAVPRIRDAFGHPNLDGTRTPATVAEVQATLQNYIKGCVVEYETAKQAMATRNAIGQENWN